MLPLRADPKTLIARDQELRVDLNSADFDELIRVPGIGLKTARRILESRKAGTRFKSVGELRKAGVIVGRALPFVEIDSSYQSRLSDF